MPRTIKKDFDGYWLVDLGTGLKLDGPYPNYGDASNANVELGDKPEREQAKRETEDAIKPANLKAAIAQANRTPEILASRGRLPKDDSIPYRIALEVLYLRNVRKPGSGPHRKIIHDVARQFGRKPTFVRKCASQYHELSRDDPDTLKQLRWEAMNYDHRKRQGLTSPTLKKLLGAQTFLLKILADGPVLSSNIRRMAKAAGYSPRTLARAKKLLGILATNRQGRGWAWHLSPRMPNG